MLKTTFILNILSFECFKELFGGQLLLGVKTGIKGLPEHFKQFERFNFCTFISNFELVLFII
jgi:hypothetical protein